MIELLIGLIVVSFIVGVVKGYKKEKPTTTDRTD